jgi:outer membrane receptor protein involved in Fe transport
LLATLVAALIGLNATAQTAVPTAGTTVSANTAVKLSPFEVRTDTDTGYLAAGTLAGSRLNTSLMDTPASISVMTSDFLNDTAATNVTEALTYALNAERDTSDGTGNPTGAGDLPLSIRGFSNSSLGRNYFQWGLESDTYNTERLDFSRGPNSILFGTGGPGGIINTTTKRAGFGRKITSVGLRIGAWDDYRATLDVSRQLTSNFALRLNAVQQTAKSWRDFVSSDRKGLALAATFRPFKNTEIRFDGEYGEFDRILTNPYLPGDTVTPWLRAGKPVSSTLGTTVAGTIRNTARVYVYDAAARSVQSWFGTVATQAPGFTSTGTSLTNFSVLPLKANVSGDGNRSDSQFHSAALFIEQRVGDLWLEAAASRQDSGRLWLTSANFGTVIIRADPNALLPDGRANPNVGKLYIETNGQQQTFDNVVDDLRATAAYTLDLNKHSTWLGSYSVTGLLSRRTNRTARDNGFDVNTTPVGDAIYSRNLGSANNRLFRRTYLDPFGPGAKGLRDVRDSQFSSGGVTSGYARIQDQGIRSREILNSQMIAGQAKILKDRVVITGGLRHDEQHNFSGTAVADPVTGVFPIQKLNATSTDYVGDTKTFGLVLHLTKWASAFYNKSDNFAPQSALTIFGTQLGPIFGKGKDFGLKFRLFDGRVYAAVTRYETSEVNRRNFADGGLINAFREIYEALGDPTQVSSSDDSVDTAGKGHEFELTANPTKQWRFTANFAETKGTQANNQPRLRAYIAERRAGWAAQGTRALIAPISGVPETDPKTGGPSTVATALDSIDGYIRTILGRNGVTRRQLREHTGSLFTAYTFKADSKWLNDFTAGGGIRYRSAPVVGYLANGIDPILGKGDTTVNLLFRKSVPVYGRRVQLQVNLDNILNVNDPILVDADVNGPNRFLYPNPFRWTFSATVAF